MRQGIDSYRIHHPHQVETFIVNMALPTLLKWTKYDRISDRKTK